MHQWHNEMADHLSLDGKWEVTLKDHRGEIEVPGVWEAQGYDRQIDGPARFRRTIFVPAEWHGRRIQLQFDAVSYYAQVYVNGTPVGTHTGLWSPFAFDVTESIQVGVNNEISLTVYKPGERFPMRESLAGFLPDVATTFGGIWQSARLLSFAGPAVSDVVLRCEAESGEVAMSAHVHDPAGQTAVVSIYGPDGNEAASRRFIMNGQEISVSLGIAHPERWHPDQPVLYTAEIGLESAGIVQARVRRKFGFRTLSREGDQVLLNSVPVCLRGVLNWGWYPEILCPAPDKAAIRDEFRRVRSLGYNMVKLCLYVPSPLYFDMADEEGMLLWLELPMWLPQVTSRLRGQAPLEYAEILNIVNHHPSIVIYSLGCELDRTVDGDLLGKLNAVMRSQINSALVCDNSGSGEAYGGLPFDYADFNDYHFYCDLHEFNPLIDHFRRDWRPTRPWIFGEFCDADDYRDLDEIAAAHGGQLPWWYREQNPIHPISKLAYPEQQRRMEQLQLDFDHQALQRISRQQSFVVRKAILEKVRARAGMGGYIVTGLRDTPLATSAMFDDLGRSKYDSVAFRTFNADTVLVLEQGRARVWKHGGDRPYPLDLLNHWSGSEIGFNAVLADAGAGHSGGELRWQLCDPDGTLCLEGTSDVPAYPAGSSPREISAIRFTAPQVDGARQYRLEVEFDKRVRNSWPVWIYPLPTPWLDQPALYDPSGCLTGLDDFADLMKDISGQAVLPNYSQQVLITGTFTPEICAFVQQGGKAILLQTGRGGLAAQPCPFWREAIKLLCAHPVMDAFPHRGYVDLQFYHLAADHALDTTRLQQDVPDVTHITPLIRRLDARLFTVLDYMLELRIGSGTLLASTLRFTGGMGDQVTGLKTNVAGRFLLDQMIRYLVRQT